MDGNDEDEDDGDDDDDDCEDSDDDDDDDDGEDAMMMMVILKGRYDDGGDDDDDDDEDGDDDNVMMKMVMMMMMMMMTVMMKVVIMMMVMIMVMMVMMVIVMMVIVMVMIMVVMVLMVMVTVMMVMVMMVVIMVVMEAGGGVWCSAALGGLGEEPRGLVSKTHSYRGGDTDGHSVRQRSASAAWLCTLTEMHESRFWWVYTTSPWWEWGESEGEELLRDPGFDSVVQVRDGLVTTASDTTVQRKQANSRSVGTNVEEDRGLPALWWSDPNPPPPSSLHFNSPKTLRTPTVSPCSGNGGKCMERRYYSGTKESVLLVPLGK
ncbi:unnamed protein product [Pleuronectes platessa]|uniref:Uncharacterized protein n=1 Tax=Pleuronectes platessa TaxID=8262 RepID=A0A9N7TSB4_PLEPL|nr:unnamed protein product [Pleuronectes platessa]